MQQINLYLPEFRPNREPVRAIHMAWAGLALVILLIIYSLYSSHQYTLIEQQLAHEKVAQQQLLSQLQLISAKKPSQTSAELDVKIAQLQKKLQRHLQILGMISHQDLGNDKGFSAQVNALGQASLSTISVETFSLQRGGKYAEMSGLARGADQIPLYLQRLRKEAAFTEVGFGVLNIERDSQSGLLKFNLAKAKDEKPAGGRR